ncbi:Threonine/homoserine/homoserine lactone efflux protein [Pseudorhodobacter antarcticus]|uniref:Threonine/homoserine/homoserine lactone efflux protein n=1 Tax=Pseudorhodobacter antarcticus TaxID=1077947 RepID=A0A1H8DKG4_9RHOB|nr:LysE family translocator [Pseudorhodobacter antarcticus]SEN07264.1 Threonine/homoserine/homoserine lactone efflux protein [Pseudorhodobacter antarcticus]
MTLTAFLAVAFLHLMAAISPGPAVLMAARTGVTEGMRTGTFLAFGIGAGAVIWAMAALFGLALVFQAAPALLWALKLVGAAYLLHMAWVMWRDAAQPLDMTQRSALPRAALSPFRLGLVTQLANPKPAVLFSAIFIGTVPPQTPLWVYAALLIVVFLNEALWNIFVARIFSFERTRSGYITLKTILDRVFGDMLALLGLKIAAT